MSDNYREYGSYYNYEYSKDCCEICNLCAQVLNTPKSITEEICFWAVGSIQHIGAIMQSNNTGGLRIPSETKQELNEIAYGFEEVARKLRCNKKGRYRGEDPCAEECCEKTICDCLKSCGSCKSYCKCEKDICREELYKDYKYGCGLCKEICCEPCEKLNYCDLCEILEEFLCVNAKFIIVINRLMFEGFAGEAILFEELNHFMIEQIYVSRIFERILKSPNFFDQRNVWGPDFFNKFGIGKTQFECAYIQVYFWNIISAQHNDLLQNVTPDFADQLPLATFDRLQEFKICFNDANIDLGKNYKRIVEGGDCSRRSRELLSGIVKGIIELNDCYIDFLCKLNRESQGKLLPCDTPLAFFETREHVLNEQYYYNCILERIAAVIG